MIGIIFFVGTMILWLGAVSNERLSGGCGNQEGEAFAGSTAASAGSSTWRGPV